MAKNWTLEEVEQLYRQFRPIAATSQGKKILLADPDEGARSVLSAHLQRKGFIVWSVDTALDALLLIKQRTPDCCILDTDLQPVSGIDLLETISRDSAYAGIILYISTAAFLREERMLCQIYGAAGILKKPIQPMNLIKDLAEKFTQQTGSVPQD